MNGMEDNKKKAEDDLRKQQVELASTKREMKANKKQRQQAFAAFQKQLEEKLKEVPKETQSCIRFLAKSVGASVSNGSGLPGCGPGLEPDWMVQSGLLPGKQGYPPGSGTGSNRTAVPFYGSYNFGSN